ncbi:hypothetical protein HYALB_00006362 [Hymenoscyphus albidus]|uniref:Uncharacterized protein n=1 Tax=Hymenoscyphus albidus TaxID=595503 RepID=A0A9N9LFN7_9HELO|nr:hypothetical protein HYALB_00006362 [Hymenoscyphus albidus]
MSEIASDKSPDQDAALQPVESPKIPNNSTTKKPKKEALQKYLPLSQEHCKYCGTSTKLKQAYGKLLVHSSREKFGANCYRSRNLFTQNSVKAWALGELLRFNQLISMQKVIPRDLMADGTPEKGEEEEGRP